jgi:hypothetical protein
MATVNQIQFIHKAKDRIKEPILIMGSRVYDYDAYNIEEYLREFGFSDITGIDINEGKGVHVIADLCDLTNQFFVENQLYFNTVFCMELLTHVKFPWLIGKNINNLTKKNGHVIISECFVRKLTRMPKDYWRFTYDSFSLLCDEFDFIDELAMKSLTRAKVPDLVPLNDEIFEILHERADGESLLGFYLRRIHRKFAGGKLFKVSRLLPEQTFYAIGQKRAK